MSNDKSSGPVKNPMHGIQYVVILFVIISIFTMIKAPYFNVPFTGEHSIKYNTYVEPALYMSQHNDITWYQLKYQGNPIDNPKGIFFEFDHFPLFEWGLFLAYKIIPYGSIEFKTRLFTNFIGLILLILGYVFIQKWTPKYFALIAVFLMAINPIISFSTFVTVLDSLLIVLTFTSLILLTNYLATRKISTLFLASIVFGIGISIKYSMFLWSSPISLWLIYYKRTSRKDIIKDFAIYNLLGLLFIITNISSVSILPKYPIASLLLMFLWIIVYVLLYYFITRKEQIIDRIIEKINDNMMIYFCIAVAVAIPGGILLYKILNIKAIASHYLTDYSLLLNYKYYLYMFRIQFKSYMTPTIFWLGISGILIAIATKNKDINNIIYSLIFGSFIYILIASKVMFIHNYYTMIIMILFSISAANSIYYILDNVPVASVRIIILLLLFVLIFPKAYSEIQEKLRHTEDISKVNQFIVSNTNDNDIIIHNTLLSPITIYTGRSMVFISSLVNDVIRKGIERDGFSNTMRKYHVKYLFSKGEYPPYIDFAPIFAKTDVREPRFNSRYLISKELGEKNTNIEKEYGELGNVVSKYEIVKKFKLEADFGKYKIYSFVD